MCGREAASFPNCLQDHKRRPIVRHMDDNLYSGGHIGMVAPVD